nr:reverse transcriptase domain-containing protein [Tanacetum cinerariifolium]
MRTRSRSRNNFPQQEASPAIVEPLRIKIPFLEDQFQEDPPEDPPEVPMADNRTIAELLQAPTEGYEDAIVIPKIAIAANNFELKHGLINLVQNKQFFGHDKEDPHAHIRYFNKITSTMKVPNFFPPSKTTNLRNEITRFQQRFDESFYEAWDRFNDLRRACTHHGFSELHQLDTFYNALNVNDQDSLNSAAGGTFWTKCPENACKSLGASPKFVNQEPRQSLPTALLLDKKNQSSAPAPSLTPAPVKAVEPNYVTYGGTHSYQNCPATNGNVYRDNIQDNFNQGQLHRPQVNQPPAYQAPIPQTQRVSQTDFKSYVKANDAILRNMQSQGSETLPNNTITNPKEDLKGTTTRSGVAYQGPIILTPSKVVKQGTEVTKDQVQTPSSQSTAPVQPSVGQSETQTLVSKPVVAPITLIGNKEKLSEMARTPTNEHCSAVILNNLPRKHGDLGKFLIPCEFSRMDECLALADLGAIINLMPLSVWEGLLLPELTPTCMTLELVDRSVSEPIGITKDVSIKVGVFHFLADFVVVDYEPDPRVPLILERCFLNIGRALIDVHKGELTLRIRNEAITYSLDQTVRYSANYNQMTSNKFNVIFEEYSQEVLIFFDVTTSDNPTPYDDPIVSTTSPTLTLFGDRDFLLFEEADAFLGLEDDPNSSKINPFYYDPKGDILLLEAILNSEPLPPLPNDKQYMSSFKKELKYAFPEGDNKLPVIIAKKLGDEEKSARIKEKTTFTYPYETLAYRRMPFGLCNAPGTFQRCMLAILHDMVEKTMEVFMDDFSVFGNSFENCHSRLDKMLQRYEDTNLCLNWEKSHFMVKEGIFLGHKISKNRIEVDRAKVDVIAKLPHPTTVKENPYENVLDPKEINETFLLETLGMVTFRGDSSAPWFADFANYHAGFDQTQPPQFPVVHPPPQETSIEISHDQENVINSVQTFLRKFNCYSFFETPKALLLAWDRVSEIKDAFENKQYKPEDVQELFHKLLDDLQNIHEDDDDSLYYENIEYVEASPHDSEFVSLEVEKIVIPKDEEIEDDNLCEKLLKVNLLIAEIEALKDNPTPSSE